MRHDDDRSVEIDLLLILGTFMALFGALLFPIGAGRLPFNLDGAYGLFLVIVAFQTIAIGKSPFGDVPQSWAVVVVGLCAAALGMAACFLPGALSGIARAAAGLLLVAGGLSLLVQLLLSANKARLWLRAGPTLARLTTACALVYALSVVLGLITLFPGLAPNDWTAILLLAYGGAFFFLAWVLREVAGLYPVEERPGMAGRGGRLAAFANAKLRLAPATLILQGLLLTLFGLLIVPAGARGVSLNSEGQLGLLLFIMAIQAMALGMTPVGTLSRPLWMTAVGLAFAALGIVACVVPGVLTPWLVRLIGVLNLVSGGQGLLAAYRSARAEGDAPSDAAPVPPILRSLATTQTIVSGLAFVFGVSMLAPGVVPGILMPAILVAMGLLVARIALITRTLAANQPSATP